MLTLPSPGTDRLDGDRLRDQLAEAGVVLGNDDLYLDGDRLVFPTLNDGQRSAVQAALDAHMNRPLPPDPDAEFRKALEAATTLAQIRDALLGKTGPGAQPRQPNSR